MEAITLSHCFPRPQFFMYEEKAALHEAIKDEYFDVIRSESHGVVVG